MADKDKPGKDVDGPSDTDGGTEAVETTEETGAEAAQGSDTVDAMPEKPLPEAQPDDPDAAAEDTPDLDLTETVDAASDTSVDTESGAQADDDSLGEEDTLTRDKETADDIADHADDETPEAPAASDRLDSGDGPGVAETAQMAPPPEKVIERKGGFFPMLLGGVAAAAIGYGAAIYLGVPQQDDAGRDAFEQEMRERLSDQAETLDSMSSRVDAAAQSPDLGGLETALEDVEGSVNALSGRVDALDSRLGQLDERLTGLEKRPVAEGASDAAVAAYERELQALQDAMAEQRAEIEAMAEEARAMEESAEETAQATMRRAALTRIQTALENGTSFAGALSDLQGAGVEPPAILSRKADGGVVSLDVLRETFPDAARAALAASRAVAGADGGAGGFGSFLKTQLGVRSLAPREGNDPDAVLSRAEAALAEGRLNDALAEIEALPEPGRAELADWTTRVSERLEAISAAQKLAETVN
ncbi:MAG: hypothetical protein RI571_08935 [Roseovarius sp.]|nr:hypothetical protein [Roseovarius sp.]